MGQVCKPLQTQPGCSFAVATALMPLQPNCRLQCGSPASTRTSAARLARMDLSMHADLESCAARCCRCIAASSLLVKHYNLCSFSKLRLIRHSTLRVGVDTGQFGTGCQPAVELPSRRQAATDQLPSGGLRKRLDLGCKLLLPCILPGPAGLHTRSSNAADGHMAMRRRMRRRSDRAQPYINSASDDTCSRRLGSWAPWEHR